MDHTDSNIATNSSPSSAVSGMTSYAPTTYSADCKRMQEATHVTTSSAGEKSDSGPTSFMRTLAVVHGKMHLPLPMWFLTQEEATHVTTSSAGDKSVFHEDSSCRALKGCICHCQCASGLRKRPRT